MRVLIFVMMFVSQAFSHEIVEPTELPEYLVDVTWVSSNIAGETLIYEFKPQTFTSKILDVNGDMTSFGTFDVDYKKVSDEQYMIQGFLKNTSEYIFLFVRKIEEQKIDVYLPLVDIPNKKSILHKFTAIPQ